MGGGKRRVETRCARGEPEDNKMIISQIMLKFRPIAPRPVTVESSVGFAPVKEKKAKRKYVRVKKMKKTRDQCNLTINDGDKGWMMSNQRSEVLNRGEFVTDPLRKVPELICFDASGNKSNDINIISRWISGKPADQPALGLHDVDLAMTVERRQVVESWITVESVIGTCEDGRELRLRCTDEEMWKDLETDSCPGFISNGYDEVQWVNLAYRRMVDPDPDHGGAPPRQVVVWLLVKVEKSAFEWWPGFSCRVRVVYLLSEKKKKQMTVPCDVWKMNSGGYAWRLDVKAALSLGRMN